MEHVGFKSDMPMRPLVIAPTDWKMQVTKRLTPLTTRWEPISEDQYQVTEILQMIQHNDLSQYSAKIHSYTLMELNTLQFVGMPLLHLLCCRKNLEFLRVTLDAGISVDTFSPEGNTALQIAIKERWYEGVLELLTKGADVNKHNTNANDYSKECLEPPILLAARMGDCAMAELLLEFHPDLTIIDSQWNSVLHLAAKTVSFSLIDTLLTNYAEKIFLSSNIIGDTPFHALFTSNEQSCCGKERAECAKRLINFGFGVNLPNGDRKTPLYLAVRGNHVDTALTLLESGAHVISLTKKGKNVLHAACKSGNAELLQTLIDTKQANELILMEDNLGLAPFHDAVNSSSVECCEILLQNGDHLTNEDSAGRSRCEYVLRNMPSAFMLLEKWFDKHITVSELSKSDPKFHITMDFTVLLPTSSHEVKESIIKDLTDKNSQQLLTHPLIESFLYLKWRKIHVFFYSHVFVYALFIILHSHYLASMYTGNQSVSNANYSETLFWLQVGLIFLLTVTSIIQLIANVKRYSMQLETYFKFIAISSAISLLASVKLCTNENVGRVVAAISIFFNWIELMMLLGRFPSLGIYILMFTRVSRSILKFLTAFISLIIAFAFVFSILMHEMPVFRSFPVALMKTLMMMIGEIDYESIYTSLQEVKIKRTTEYVIAVKLFLVTFLFLVPILLANLLIGLAVNDLPGLQNLGRVSRLVKEASYLVSYERVLHVLQSVYRLAPLRWLAKYNRLPNNMTVYPNRSRIRRHGHFSTTIPSETLTKAISIGLKDFPVAHCTSDHSNRDLSLFVSRYWLEYQENYKNMEKSLRDMNSLLRQCIDVKDMQSQRARCNATPNRSIGSVSHMDSPLP